MDKAEATKYCRRADDKDCSWAQRSYAWNRMNGIGAPKDEAEAVRYMNAAVELGNP
jgi:TPR repeat protein